MSVSKTRSADHPDYPYNLFSQKLHKIQQEKALDSFYQDPMFRNVVKILRRMIPANASPKDKRSGRSFEHGQE